MPILCRIFPISLIAVSLLALRTSPAYATDEQLRKIVAIELQMQKINCNLHLEGANPDFKKSRRTWLWDISNGVLTEGGLVAATALFANNAFDKVNDQGKIVHNQAHGVSVGATLYPQIAGQGIGASGALFELLADFKQSRKMHKAKLDQKSVIAKMAYLNEQADRCLLNAAAIDEYRSDVILLSELKLLILREFVRLQSQANSQSFSHMIEDSVSLARNTVGLAGNAINAKAVVTNNRRLNGKGAILNLIAACLIEIRPILSDVGSRVVETRNRNRALKAFPELFDGKTLIEPESSEDLQARLLRHMETITTVERKQIYREQIALTLQQNDLSDFENKKLRTASVRRYRESLYAPAKQTQAITGIIIGFQHSRNATQQNKLAIAGNVSYTSGQAFNILELLRERVVDERAHSLLRDNHMLPEDRIRRQLSKIDDIQKLL